MIVSRHSWQAAVVCVIAIAAAAACSPAPAAVSGPTGTPAAAITAGPAATPAPVATAAPTRAATTAPTKALPTVDLVLSGPYAVTAKGTKGQCMLGNDSAGNAKTFGFGAVEADYPGLGTGLYISESTGIVTVKFLVNATVGLLYVGDNKGVSADHHSISLDADITGGTITEHIKGTITCP